MRAILVAAALLLGAATSAIAQLPPRAQNWQDAYFTTCRTYGGRASIQPGYQTSIDLNGDGRVDHIMDMRRIACSSREGAAAMCSSGGGACSLFVYLSTPSGYRDPPQQFEVTAWSLERDASPPALNLRMAQGSGRYAWNGSTLAQGGAPAPAPAPQAAAPPPASRPQSSPPAGQPAPVAQATQGLMRDCRGFGGRPSFLEDFQTTLDLNEDGQPDYILDVERLNCEGAASALCAGVGCPLQVFLSSPSGYRDVSPGHFAKGWEIDRGTSPPTLVLHLDAAACGARARAPCTPRYRWNGTTLAELGAAAPPAAVPAPASAPATRPAIVARGQNDIFAMCRDSGGRPSAMEGFETVIDLNQDSQPDYIHDSSKVNCEGAASALCGSAGCPLSIYLSGPGGYRAGFGSYTQDWRIEQGSSPPVLVLDMHGSACGRVGSDTCTRRYAWNGRQIAELGAGARPGRVSPGGAAGGGAGGDKVETALPRPMPAPSPGAWELRQVSGNPTVATAPGPGVIQSVSLLCFQGAPVVAFVMRAKPPPGRTVLSFGFRRNTVDVVLAEHPQGGGTVFQANLAGTALPRLLAGSDGAVPIRINGGQQGALSLAGSGEAVREALADCYRF